MKIKLEKAAPLARVMGGRTGTAIATLDQLKDLLGEPSYTCGPELVGRNPLTGENVYDSPKVTTAWIFKTPRGLAEVRDYWWNRKNEQSIACAGALPNAGGPKASLWLAAYLRGLGIKAAVGHTLHRTITQELTQ